MPSTAGLAFAGIAAGIADYQLTVTSHGATPTIAASKDCLHFNPSYIPASSTFNRSGVLLRMCCGPSCTGHGVGMANAVAERIGYAPCDLETGTCGRPDADFNLDPSTDTEDPRAFWYEGYYYNFYYSSNATHDPSCTGSLCTVRLAKTRTPLVSSSWQHLRTFPWHRNGCCAMRPKGERSYCIWGEGPGPSPGLGIWFTTDISDGNWTAAAWSVAPGVASPLSADHKYLLPLGASASEIKLEAGAHPVRLSSGDWLHFYAAATPGWVEHGNYTVGWIILDGADPSTIVQRSATHVLIPTFEYETLCGGAADCPYRGERKNVIFGCSATLLASTSSEPDRVRLFFGGGDGNVGTAVIQVSGGRGPEEVVIVERP